MPNRPEYQHARDDSGRLMSNKGVSREIRRAKHLEAAERNIKTPMAFRRAQYRSMGYGRRSAMLRHQRDESSK